MSELPPTPCSRDDFRRAFELAPDDPLLRFVIADWLEERGDPAAPVVRQEAERLLRRQRRERKQRMVTERRVLVRRADRRLLWWLCGTAALVFFVAVAGEAGCVAGQDAWEGNPRYVVRPHLAEMEFLSLLGVVFGATSWAAAFIPRLIWVRWGYPRLERLIWGRYTMRTLSVCANGAVSVLCLLRVLSLLNTHTAITERGLTIQNVWCAGQPMRRGFDEIRRIYLGRESHFLVVVFNDGTLWSTAFQGVVRPKRATEAEIASFLADRSHRRVQQVDSIWDVDRGP